MEALADFIFGLHVLLFLFVVLTPFIGSPDLILIDLMLMVSVYFHWILRDNTCVLTVIEKTLRGTPDDKQTFFGQLFGQILVASYRSHGEARMLIHHLTDAIHKIKW